MDSNLCAKFDLHILTGFWDTLVETEQQQQEEEEEKENWKVTIQISLMYQKLDLIEIESETRKSQCMGIMQDNLCHPNILSTTVLSVNARYHANPYH